MTRPITFGVGKKVDLRKIPTGKVVGNWNKATAKKRIEENAEKMADMANFLYAENRRSILLVLQGMDTAGKDGTIRTVMKGVNPRSCQVVSFKRPSEEELDHDFLWRVHQVVPKKGNIGIFNRSHYEDVLVVRVHNLVPEEPWKQRFEQINNFEKLLVENGMTIIKCFLHVGKEEQRIRLQERIENPDKRWKFNVGDLAERKLWDVYQKAYEDALSKCNTEHAPWHIIPSDREWYRNLLVSELMCQTLKKLNPKNPTPAEDYSSIVVE
jgi:PPK2 family polyphosphate:nucleotide phosphotransferase